MTSKDLSIVEIDNITLSNTKVGITAYQKNPNMATEK